MAKRKFTRFAALFLSIGMVLSAGGIVPSQETAYAAEDTIIESSQTVTKDVYASATLLKGKEAPASFNGKRVLGEETAKRSSNSKHYLLEDGSYQAVFSLEDTHYLDENDKWQDIRTELVDEADLRSDTLTGLSKAAAPDIRSVLGKQNKSVQAIDRKKTSYRVPYAPFDAKLPKNYSDGYTVGKEDDQITFIPQDTNISAGVIDAVYKNKITYENVWDNVDVSLQMTSSGVKEDIILKNASAPTTFRFELLGDVNDSLEAGQLRILPAWLVDANGTQKDVVQELRREEGKTYLELSADTTGLAYPVVIDPTVTIKQPDSFDAYITSGCNTCNYGTYYELEVGSDDRYRSLIQFNLQSIPQNSTISTATMELQQRTGHDIFSTTISVFRITSTWSENSVTWVNSPSIDTVSIAYAYAGSATNSPWIPWDIKTLVQNWVSNIYPNYGLALRSYGDLRSFTSNNWDGNGPRLIVNYTPPNVAPGAPAIISPSGGEVVDATHTITWGAATDPDNVQSSLKYQVQLFNGSVWKDVLTLSNANQTSYAYNFSSEPNTTQARIQVRAYDGALYGPWAQSNTFTIRHNQAPNAPINLSPGSVSTSSPVPTLVGTTPTVNWTFSDPDAGDSQSAYNVVVYENSTFKYSTGWITGGATSFTIPSSANLTRSTLYNWKVQTRDSKGLESPQSTAMYVKINSLPTLNITSYTNGQSVSDNVLTFDWTYSDSDGQAQKAFQVQGSQNNFSTIAYDSGTKNLADTRLITPPLGSGAWSFRIRVFDGLEWSNWASRNLTLPNSFESNDNPSQAFPIQYNNTYTTLLGTIGDEDFFKYTATSTGIDRVKLTVPAGKNYDVYIYDANQNLIASGVKSAGLQENVIYEVTSGATYYVRIFGAGGDYSATLTYSLIVSQLSMNFQADYEYDFNGNIKKKTTTRIN